MSRRRPTREDKTFSYVVVVVECQHHRGVPLGRVVRQLGRDMLEQGLDRLDGPQGETVVRARCAPCRATRGSDLQVRWEALAARLDRLETEGRHADTHTV